MAIPPREYPSGPGILGRGVAGGFGLDATRFSEDLRPFRRGELALARALAVEKLEVPPAELQRLRYALRLAQLSGIGPRPDGLIEPLESYRLRLLQLLAPALPTAPEEIEAPALHDAAPAVAGLVEDARREVRRAGVVSDAALDAELAHKHLVLVLGGAAGCGYVYLGALARLEELGLAPSYLVGCSIGSVLAVLRARSPKLDLEELFREVELLRTVAALGAPTRPRFGLPAAARLDLHRALAPLFTDADGTPTALRDLAIPVDTLVTGLRPRALTLPQVRWRDRRGARARDTSANGEPSELSEGPTARAVASLVSLAVSRRLLVPLLLGADPETAALPALDAAGFSSAIPALLQYELPPGDAANAERLEKLFARHELGALADGLLATATPARLAWEALERGRIGSRHYTIVALHALEAEQSGARALLSPLQRAFAATARGDKPFWDVRVSFRRAPSLFDFVPSREAVHRAVETGREEFAEVARWLPALLAPVPPWAEIAAAPARAGQRA